MDPADQDGKREVGDATQAWLLTELPKYNISARPQFRHWRAITMLLVGFALVTVAGMFLYHEELLAWKRGRHEERHASSAPPPPVVATPTVLPDAGPTKIVRRPNRRPRPHPRTANRQPTHQGQ